MTAYWVSYTIKTATGMAGTGTCAIDMAAPPRTVDQIMQLANEITEVARGRGELPYGHHVAVNSWSRMGD